MFLLVRSVRIQGEDDIKWKGYLQVDCWDYRLLEVQGQIKKWKDNLQVGCWDYRLLEVQGQMKKNGRIT
jgi:predicted FMN-binding regulatory protein PaiB